MYQTPSIVAGRKNGFSMTSVNPAEHASVIENQPRNGIPRLQGDRGDYVRQERVSAYNNDPVDYSAAMFKDTKLINAILYEQRITPVNFESVYTLEPSKKYSSPYLAGGEAREQNDWLPKPRSQVEFSGRQFAVAQQRVASKMSQDPQAANSNANTNWNTNSNANWNTNANTNANWNTNANANANANANWNTNANAFAGSQSNWGF